MAWQAAAALGTQIGAGIGTKAVNLWSAERQIDFQREMANSGYQRAMKDMKKAGLNPALAARQGPAPAPAGTKVDLDSSSATSAAQLMNQGPMMKAQIMDITSGAQLKDAQANDLTVTQQERLELMRAQAYQTLQHAEKTKGADTDKIRADIRLIEEQIRRTRQETLNSAFDSKKKEAISKLWDIPLEAGKTWKQVKEAQAKRSMRLWNWLIGKEKGGDSE